MSRLRAAAWPRFTLRLRLRQAAMAALLYLLLVLVYNGFLTGGPRDAAALAQPSHQPCAECDGHQDMRPGFFFYNLTAASLASSVYAAVVKSFDSQTVVTFRGDHDDGSPAAGASAPGCGKYYFFKGTKSRSLHSGGKKRNYDVHLPSNYDSNTPMRVVVGFSGSDTPGWFFKSDTGLNQDKYSHDTIMVYPDGYREALGLPAWAGPNYSKVTEAEDLQFVEDMLNELRQDFCVDNSRIYATGLSNGGGFVNTIACAEVGKNFAALAPVAGSYFDEYPGYADPNAPPGERYKGCTPSRHPIPMLFIHGARDTKCPIGGAEQGDAARWGKLPSVDYVITNWADRNRCGPAQSSSRDAAVQAAVGADDGAGVDSGSIHHTSYTCGGQKGVLQFWKLDYLIHRWPSKGFTMTGLLGKELQGGPISANELILDFFSQWRLSDGSDEDDDD